MSCTVEFAQVDVFSSHPYQGNPVAVILNADGFSDDDMQTIARWTNLSETTFVMAPTIAHADYRVRIFTPGGEIPFAGHPTLGTARAWLDSRGRTSKDPNLIVQECAAGRIDVRVFPDHLAFAAPPMIHTGELDPETVTLFTRGLGIEPEQVVAHQWVDNGPGWAVIMLPSAQEVLALNPDFSSIPDAMVGVIGPYPPGSPFAFELRSFAPRVGVPEDPVCGSMNASVAQWLTSSRLAPAHYRVSQGSQQHRTGEITISVDDTNTVWVGGTAQVLFHGHAIVP